MWGYRKEGLLLHHSLGTALMEKPFQVTQKGGQRRMEGDTARTQITESLKG